MKDTVSKVVKTIIARCEPGEDLQAALTTLVKKHNIESGCFQIIGAVIEARLGILENGKYDWFTHSGPLEISSCVGNVTVKDGEPFVHAHAMMNDFKGTVIGGHVGEGCKVFPTAEIHMQVFEGRVERKLDPACGFTVMNIE